MNKTDLNKEIKRLSGLVGLKGKSEAYIQKLAEKNLFVRELVNNGNFVDDNEKKEAKRLFDLYLKSNDFENTSDLQTLGNLVYNEILVQRIQRTINETKNKAGNYYVNDKLVKSLHDTEHQILELKKILGLTKEKKNDDLTALEEMEKQFELEIAFNKNEFTTDCKHCGKLLLLRRRCKDFESLKHPFFCGRFYYNARGMQLVKDGIWTPEQYAYVFHTTVLWVQWCIEHEGEIVEVGELPQETIEEYMKDKPHLKGARLIDSEKFQNKK
jgi:hypothetical protein